MGRASPPSGPARGTWRPVVSPGQAPSPGLCRSPQAGSHRGFTKAPRRHQCNTAKRLFFHCARVQPRVGWLQANPLGALVACVCTAPRHPRVLRGSPTRPPKAAGGHGCRAVGSAGQPHAREPPLGRSHALRGARAAARPRGCGDWGDPAPLEELGLVEAGLALGTGPLCGFCEPAAMPGPRGPRGSEPDRQLTGRHAGNRHPVWAWPVPKPRPLPPSVGFQTLFCGVSLACGETRREGKMANFFF